MAEPMPFEHMEGAYESLAQAIDTVGPANEALFLTKLVLLLAHRQGDIQAFHRAMKTAMQDLPG